MIRNLQIDAENFFWYARNWRIKGDRLAFQALMELKEQPGLHPSLLKRIVEIESNEAKASGSLRTASVS